MLNNEDGTYYNLMAVLLFDGRIMKMADLLMP